MIKFDEYLLPILSDFIKATACTKLNPSILNVLTELNTFMLLLCVYNGKDAHNQAPYTVRMSES